MSSAADQDTRRDMITADDPAAAECVAAYGGVVDHDYRPYTHRPYKGRDTTATSWRCVWCHVVACGDYGEHDPCWRAYHHPGQHRSRNGVTWPKGGNRPDQ